jgi:PAS domain-containing protein
VLAANAILTGSLALRVWRQSQVPGRRAFAGTMMALAIWAGGYAFETLAPSVEAKTAWLRVENLGIVTLVPLFFLFALRYTGGSVAASRWALGFVSVAAAVLLLGIAAPWAANVYYLAGMVWPGLASSVDFTPLAFGVLGLVYGVGVFRLRLFDIVPLARDAVLEGLPDVVLVLDSDDRVADLNKAAAGLLGASRAAGPRRRWAAFPPSPTAWPRRTTGSARSRCRGRRRAGSRSRSRRFTTAWAGARGEWWSRGT